MRIVAERLLRSGATISSIPKKILLSIFLLLDVVNIIIRRFCLLVTTKIPIPVSPIKRPVVLTSTVSPVNTDINRATRR